MISFILACAHLDPIAIVKTGGYIGLAVLVFAESGLFIGIFLPGDSLLFAAGLLCAGGFLAFGPLAVVVAIAAILGDTAGYWFGANVGDNLFNKKNSPFFKQEYVVRTQKFYRKYGGRAVVLARFVPVVRTIAPILAGVGKMKYTRFVSYNALGGVMWGAGMTALGYFLGTLVPGSETYVLPISLLIVVLSFIPIIINLTQGKSLV